jgi:hypothetical protein
MKKLSCIIGILLAVVVVVGVFACGGAKKEVEGPPSGWKTYQNEEHGFSLYYPEDWEQTYAAGTTVAFASPDVDEFRENVNVVVESCGDMGLEEYVAANKQSMPQIIPGARISNEKPVEVHGREGYEWILRFSTQGFDLKDKQVCFVAHGKGYVLTCTALESTYDQYADTFHEMVYSFVIE